MDFWLYALNEVRKLKQLELQPDEPLRTKPEPYKAKL